MPSPLRRYAGPGFRQRPHSCSPCRLRCPTIDRCVLVPDKLYHSRRQTRWRSTPDDPQATRPSKCHGCAWSILPRIVRYGDSKIIIREDLGRCVGLVGTPGIWSLRPRSDLGGLNTSIPLGRVVETGSRSRALVWHVVPDRMKSPTGLLFRGWIKRHTSGARGGTTISLFARTLPCPFSQNTVKSTIVVQVANLY